MVGTGESYLPDLVQRGRYALRDGSQRSITGYAHYMADTGDFTSWSAISELRLHAFKSFRGAVLPLDDLTLVIGRNGSGKSNALEALETLAHLAGGTDIREAIDGSRLTATPIRGGIEGSTPYGSDELSLGCSIACGDQLYDYDITIRADDATQVVHERLVRIDDAAAEDAGRTTLFETLDPDPDSADILARCSSNPDAGSDPATITFRASRTVLAQITARAPSGTEGERAVHAGVERVIAALRSVFVLDPVPQAMREYVPRRDFQLRRQADNISAAVARVRADPERWSRLLELVRALPENEVADISIEHSSLGDVIIALHERVGDSTHAVSARLVSDGMLRYIAFAVALLEPRRSDADAGEAQTTLVIEEIENGLHPSQAARVVQLLKEESVRQPVRALATTHSPALLTALAAEDHQSVIICDRDPATGLSRLRRLTELPAYQRFMAQGTLGDAVTRDRLAADGSTSSGSSAIDELIRGI